MKSNTIYKAGKKTELDQVTLSSSSKLAEFYPVSALLSASMEVNNIITKHLLESISVNDMLDMLNNGDALIETILDHAIYNAAREVKSMEGNWYKYSIANVSNLAVGAEKHYKLELIEECAIVEHEGKTFCVSELVIGISTVAQGSVHIVAVEVVSMRSYLQTEGTVSS